MEIPHLGRKPDHIAWESLKPISTRKVILGDILREQPNDPLGLLDEEVEAETFDTSKHRIYSIYFGSKPLIGQDLISLLTHARSLGDEAYRRLGQTRDGILADWRILDDIGRNRWLVLIHQLALGSYWTEFDIYHRNKIKEALEAPTAREIKDKMILRMEDELVRRHLIPYPAWSVDVIWQDWEAFQFRNNKELYCIEPRYNSEEEKQLIGNQILHNDPAIRHPDTVTVRNADSLAIFTIQRNERERKVEVRYAAGQIKDHSSKAVIPWILYALPKDGGRPIYISSQEPDSLKRDERADTLVGLLSALYLSPDVKATLPTRLALRVGLLGGLINLRITLAKQDMLEAQMPLLGSMRRGTVIKGSFITQATEFLDSQVGFNNRSLAMVS